jgi:hypothetical protein
MLPLVRYWSEPSGSAAPTARPAGRTLTLAEMTRLVGIPKTTVLRLAALALSRRLGGPGTVASVRDASARVFVT